ncbi:Hypothetical_protein [Hexamita inflata]|uniref:Hypothetical_protein n=1 Tax=Hexamita inflata TaxID=28002 RepID=A0AA86RJZ0_9EUKA|nr:Hypothetical protein HINF_LOCUS63551 [Hexamita inflata]CAI9975907.1 Hypothetical protein HINF_LOCUS63552 [Hexamita inflata]
METNIILYHYPTFVCFGLTVQNMNAPTPQNSMTCNIYATMYTDKTQCDDLCVGMTCEGTTNNWCCPTDASGIVSAGLSLAKKIIIGVCVGGGLLLILSIVGCYFCCCRPRKQQQQTIIVAGQQSMMQQAGVPMQQQQQYGQPMNQSNQVSMPMQ